MDHDWLVHYEQLAELVYDAFLVWRPLVILPIEETHAVRDEQHSFILFQPSCIYTRAP